MRRWLLLAGSMGVALAAVWACTNTQQTTVYVYPDSGPPPPQDSGAPLPPPPCGPSDVSMLMPSWKPPVGPNAGACSDAQLTSLVASCFTKTSSFAMCNAWLHDPNNQTCFGCWQGPVSAAMWAPFVYARTPGETDYVNIGGCVALADPAQLACGQAIQAEFECEMQACLNACPIPAEPSPSADGGEGGAPDAGTFDAAVVEGAVQNLYACFNYVDQTGCSRYVQAVAACAPALEDAGPAAFCFVANNDTNALKQLFTLACGGAPADGGPPPDAADGAASDAPADAALDAPDGG